MIDSTVPSSSARWRTFEDARAFAQALKPAGSKEWHRWSRGAGRPTDIPASPGQVYKNRGWVGYGDWLGTGNVKGHPQRVYLPFEDAREFVRALKLRDQKDWQAWCKGTRRRRDIPTAPRDVYKDSGWVSLGDWLGTGSVATFERVFLPFSEARRFVRSLKLAGQKEWQTWARTQARSENIPASPDRIYKDQGWVSWGDWLGTGAVATQNRTFLSFDDARAYAGALRLSTKEGWGTWARTEARPENIPAGPDNFYKDQGWISWGDWLGRDSAPPINRVFLPFEKAREYARGLHFANEAQWMDWGRTAARPKNIPAQPRASYKDEGWISIDDWLGLDVPNRWDAGALRRFVASLQDHLASLTPAELHLLFQQNGMLSSQGAGREFAKALITGRLPGDELGKFVKNKPSKVDEFFQDVPDEAQGVIATAEPVSATNIETHDSLDIDLVTDVRAADEVSDDLPIVQSRDALAALDRIVSSADAEAVEFLVASAVAKIWRHTFRDEQRAVSQAEQAIGSEYVQRAAGQFLHEYREATALQMPARYSFKVNGRLTLPTLMQRLLAVRVRDGRRVGNWSGTGAGKTLAAVLASRVVDAGLTVVCCPNSIVDDGWRATIKTIFPDDPAHRFLVLNYEKFQQPGSPELVRSLVEGDLIDMIVIDEVQSVKQRDEAMMSQRRTNVAMLVSQAAARNADLRVLGMSATPVVNNLQEAKSLVELITGVEHPELNTQATVANCMKLYQRLVSLGIREMPNYAITYEEVEESVDCGAFLDEIRALGRRSTPLDLELILTQARLPAIVKHLKKGTLIYTHLVTGVERLLRDAVQDAGFTVGSFTGEDKTGKNAFLRGDVDVLIGSSAIGTGVDGLQQVCDTLIMNVLPWTAAEFDQIKGRIFRQGQGSEKVKLVLPLTFANVHGERWSWCESKMQRLHFKRSIADAAVDGVVPVGHLRSQAQALRDVMGWLQRLDAGQVETISRQRILIPLPPVNAAEAARRNARYGEFSTMNNVWNRSRSETTHERLVAHPDEWSEYHSRYREARKNWPVVPFAEIIRYYVDDQGLVIGDFGCGEAQIAEALSNTHTVHSFDHVAINERVIACDMSHVPLADNSLDAAVFSLSLMGANFTDYVREAYRVLKRDRPLHIYEVTTRFGNRDAFARGLRLLGFDVVEVQDRWRFTYFKAVKSSRAPQAEAKLGFATERDNTRICSQAHPGIDGS